MPYFKNIIKIYVMLFLFLIKKFFDLTQSSEEVHHFMAVCFKSQANSYPFFFFFLYFAGNEKKEKEKVEL